MTERIRNGSWLKAWILELEKCWAEDNVNTYLERLINFEVDYAERLKRQKANE